MLGRLPRRFRSRILLVVILIGISVLCICSYIPIPGGNLLKIRNTGDEPSPTGWWMKWWPTDGECKFGTPKPASERVDTADIYSKLDFNLPDNRGIGFWNEVLESRYREIKKTWKDLPLEVIVVPHSHVDPGWLRTYDEYFDASVSNILDNMVKFLNKTEDFAFIWSEISYFSNWWNKQNKNTQETVKLILKKKKLEVLTGGWVMVDEATTSYFSVVDQLIEGHQWLKHFTGVQPQNGWSVDVFGHSASIPYILSSSGISNTVILRAHYAWKAFLAEKRWFDFYWEQPFNSPRILCHMAPSDLYSFKHTCGPDPFSCLNYDFRRIGGEMSESTSEVITDHNVELKANYLLAQYGRYASLFNHNVLLVPLGDDFRFNVYSEWEQQYGNYKKLFDYINMKTDWNARVRFGTVADYFDKVHQRLENVSTSALTSITGDFFPYADVYANGRPSYWTGYYTTRPFYKKLARELEHWLRSAEILYSFAKMMVRGEDMKLLFKDYPSLISARQNLALFQHHDAITGTSRKFVMQDYGQRLHSAMTNALTITSHLTQMLLMNRLYEETTWTSQVYPDVYRSVWNQHTKKLSLSTPNNGRKIILFNSLTISRTETVRLTVRSSDIKVLDSEGNCVPSQLNPTWKGDFTLSNSVFELIFVVTLKPLSFSTYSLINIFEANTNQLSKSVISLFMRDDSMDAMRNPAFHFEKPKDIDINLESSRIRAKFSPSGVLKEIYLKDSGYSRSVDIDFKAYIPWLYRSGAYLFRPDFPDPIPLSNLTNNFPFLCVVRGPIVTELNLIYLSFYKFTVRLYNHESAPAGLELQVMSDISILSKDVELVMRVNSDVMNDGVFFTDSNGLQMLKRKYVTNLPVQGNYYPATSGMYIEDESFRLCLLIPHSHGVTSPLPGTMEVMLDRRMSNDDGRGMSEGVEDNQMISTTFWLVPESISSGRSVPPSLSPTSHLLSLRAQYPIMTFVTDNGESYISNKELSFLSHPWPPDVHLVNIRTLPQSTDYNRPSNSSLLVVHERYDTCKLHSFVDRIVNDVREAQFSNVKSASIVKTSLTGTLTYVDENDISSSTSLSKLQTCKVTFS